MAPRATAPGTCDGGGGSGAPPAWGGPDHPELRRLSVAAAEGREVEAFHLALGRNQVRACRVGTYGGGLGIGGELLLAEVSERGAECRTVGEL